MFISIASPSAFVQQELRRPNIRRRTYKLDVDDYPQKKKKKKKKKKDSFVKNDDDDVDYDDLMWKRCRNRS